MNNIRRYIFALAASLTLASCGDFLEEYSQDHDYVRTWTDLNELLIGDGYMPVHSSGEFQNFANYGMFLHLFADEVEENNSGSASAASFDQHQYQFGYLTWAQRLGTNESYTGYYKENHLWTKMYKCINVANNVLHSAENLPETLGQEREGKLYVQGQAHFLRGFYYFWLTNLYGQPYNPATASRDLGVPIKTTQEVIDQKYSRNTIEECYRQVLSDLLMAEEELSEVTKIPRKSIYRADYQSVVLLLGRVYLYMQNWQKAAEYARKLIVMHPSLYDMNENSSAFASKYNEETIFSMGGDDLPNFMNASVQCLRVSSSLYGSYSANDLRQSRWYWKYGPFQGVTKQPYVGNGFSNSVTDPNYYYGHYQSTSSQRDISSLFWLRSGEAYLNLAEAEAYLGNDDAAREAVNAIRCKRMVTGAPDVEITSSGSTLVADIRNERRRELACEGHRWFDLRRYRVCSVCPEKLSLTHTYTYYGDRGSAEILETHKFTLTEDDPSWTAPIPQEVIDFNVGMPNNGNLFRDYEIVATPQ